MVLPHPIVARQLCTLPPGTMLVVEVDEEPDPDSLVAMRDQLRDVAVLLGVSSFAVLMPGMTLRSLTDEDLAEHGLMRIPTDETEE